MEPGREAVRPAARELAIRAAAMEGEIRRAARRDLPAGRGDEFDDLFQEAILRALRTRGRIPVTPGEIRAWMLRVMRNERIRARSRSLPCLDPERLDRRWARGGDAGGHLPAGMVVAEALERMRFARRRPLKHDPGPIVRQVLFEGRPLDRVARENGVSRRTVELDLARLRAAMTDDRG